VTQETSTRRVIERVVISLWREETSFRAIDRHLRTIRVKVSEDEIRRIVRRYICAKSENASLGRRKVFPAKLRAYKPRQLAESSAACLALICAMLMATLNDWVASIYEDED
jgi:hypothetical protein